jgi:transcription termination factor NusB
MTNRYISTDDLVHSLNKHLTFNDFKLARDADDSVNFLGSGGFGDAYANEHGYVLKITESMTEALYAIRLMNTNTSKHCVEIQGVYVTGGSEQRIVIVQEELETESIFVQRAQSILSDMPQGAFDLDLDGLLKKYKDHNNIEHLDLELHQILVDLYISFSHYELAGCYPNDINLTNIGSKVIDGVDRIILFDQMGDINFESSMVQIAENIDSLPEAFKEYMTEVEFNRLTIIDNKMLTDYLYMAELTEAYDDLIYALNTDSAFQHLVDGDWVAGGCYAFSQLFFQEWESLRIHNDIVDITSPPELITVTSKGGGRSTTVYEHTCIKIGSLIVDGSGIHGINGFIDTFVSENIPMPLPGTHYQLESISKDKLDNSEIAHVDIQALRKTLDVSQIMPSQLALHSSLALHL